MAWSSSYHPKYGMITCSLFPTYDKSVLMVWFLFTRLACWLLLQCWDHGMVIFFGSTVQMCTQLPIATILYRDYIFFLTNSGLFPHNNTSRITICHKSFKTLYKLQKKVDLPIHCHRHNINNTAALTCIYIVHLCIVSTYQSV